MQASYIETQSLKEQVQKVAQSTKFLQGYEREVKSAFLSL